MRKIILFGVLSACLGCKSSDFQPDKNFRLKTSVFLFEDAEEINHFWSSYAYNDEGLLISRILNDTTFLLKSKLYRPAKNTTTYLYDKDGYLVERTIIVESTAASGNTVTTYSYFNKKLIREKNEAREIVYNYDNENRLINTVSTSFNTGLKSITSYMDDVPGDWEKDGKGYKSRVGPSILYYDENLLLKKGEKYNGNVITYQEDWTYADTKHPLATIAEWKGFPKLKGLAYRTGVEQNIRKYMIENNVKIDMEEKNLTQTINEKGLLTNSKGTERLKINTPEAFTRKIELKYFYEEY